MLDDPYGDARLVALYDEDNPDGPDHDFYRALADEVDARTIVDLGCGTGILTVTLAGGHRTVIGVDPSATMLAHAATRPGGEEVRWVLGDSSAVGRPDADLAIMTGNVAQHIVGDAWPRTLRELHDALRPGGTLAFESRNPMVRAWETWSDDRTTRPTADGPLTEWMELAGVDDGLVTFAAHNLFESTGERVTTTLRLAFRSVEELTDDLAAAGLVVESVYGGWDGRPLADDSALIVVRAARPVP